MNNLLSYYGLIDSRMSASGTDLPVYHVTKPSDLLGLNNRLLGLSLKTIMYILTVSHTMKICLVI